MAAENGVESAAKELERVAKKQKTCTARTADALGKLVKALEGARSRLAAMDPAANPGAALAELRGQLASLGTSTALAAETKDLHGAVAKLGKAVDKHFSMDVCKAAREGELDRAALNQVIAEHLFHEGQFEIGDAFVGEAGLGDGEALKRPYASMHTVLQQIHRRNLAPALAWVAEHRGALGPASAFEFSLHTLAFLQTLKDQGQSAALAYARRSLPPFARTHMPAIQRLMGALVFARRPGGLAPGEPGSGGGSDLAKAGPGKAGGKAAMAVEGAAEAAAAAAAAAAGGPYSDLYQLEELWAGLARDFVRTCCALLGQAQDSPLLVTVAAGSAALPTLLKLASVKAVQPAVGLAGGGGGGGGNGGGSGAGAAAAGAGAGEPGEEEQLPVEIPLGREFVFHSIFACPVSREQSGADNPPWMLPCGHVMCKQSVLKIAKAATRPFKCPYCPQEATPGQCKEIVFPDME